MRAKVVACLLVGAWIGWFATALYVSHIRQLPQVAEIRPISCDLVSKEPLLAKPRHNYDYQAGKKYGSIA